MKTPSLPSLAKSNFDQPGAMHVSAPMPAGNRCTASGSVPFSVSQAICTAASARCATNSPRSTGSEQLEKMRVLPDAWHWPLRGDAEQIYAKEPDHGAGREQARIAERGIAGDVILPGIDRQAADEPHDDRHRRRRGGTSAEETPVFGWRDEIAHPRVPGAAADRRRALVNGKRPD